MGESDAQRVADEALADLAALGTSAALEDWRVRILGKSGAMTALMKGLGALPKEERPAAGKVLNEVRSRLEAALEERKADIDAKELAARLERERVDVTLPGVDVPLGNRHPIAATLEDLRDIFRSMGFLEAQGPEVESDVLNFELLNMPADHPARDMWDTFYAEGEGDVLRTHTSPVQIRVMRERAPEPVKVICPGKVYRYEQVTARTEFMFHQVEGLEVGPNVTMRDLLAVLQGAARRIFGPGRQIRVRNSYFPFTEPSMEVDVDCFNCESKGCGLCKRTGWIEILGAGMVHPTVLRNGGYDPDKVSGYAFGMGVERMAMLRYRIDDIRHFYRNDVRFLRQFRAL
ncbi:MAG: phenylalanine--tRNA ligase alpha subunit [Myxococcales bacterium]